LSSEVANISGQIDSLAFDVSSVSSTVDLLPSSTAEPVDISSIEGRLNDLARGVNSVDSEVSDLSSRLDDLSSRLDDVCIALSAIPPYEGC